MITVIMMMIIIIRAPLLTWINLNCNIYCKVLDEITNPFKNYNGAAVEVFEWISIFILHFIGRVITQPWWD